MRTYLHTFRQFLKLSRFDHCLGFSILVFLICLIYNVPIIPSLILSTVTLFSTISIFIHNNIVDYKIDLINKRYDNPIVTGFPIKTAKLLCITSLIFSIFLALFLPINVFILFIFATLLGFIYNLKIKKIILVSNFFVALSISFPFIFASIILHGLITKYFAKIIIFTILFNLAREIMKDIEDIKGDRVYGVKTIANTFGIKNATIISSVLFMLSIIFVLVTTKPSLILIPASLTIFIVIKMLLCDVYKIKIYRRLTFISFTLFVLHFLFQK